MKTLLAIPCLLTGGTEIQTLSLVKALISAGHNVAIAAYFEHNDDMVAAYRAAGADVFLLSPDGKRPAGTKATVRFLYKQLRRVVKQVRPDVAHVQYMAPGAIPIILLRLLGVRKIVATTHTGADIYPSLRLLKWVHRHILHSLQCISLTAEKSYFGDASLFHPDMPLKRHGNHFTIYNTLPDYITPLIDQPVHPNVGTRFIASDRPVHQHVPRIIPHQPLGHPDASYRPAHPDNTPSAPWPSGCGRDKSRPYLTVGVVSRLEKIKGMDLVVPAFAKASEGRELRLHVVGDGSLRKEMERQAEDLGIADRVEFVGRQPQAALQDLYDRIDILLMPSRSEGFGLTAIEGMARGCVPVVSRVGGLPEVVADGQTGLIHEPEDVDGIAAAIGQLADDPTLLSALSLHARNASMQYSPARYARDIAAWYKALY